MLGRALIAVVVSVVLALALAPRGIAGGGGAVNNPGCEPTRKHPYPVVLVHGTFLDRTEWDGTVAPALAAAGYCVLSLDYGNRGTGDIERSAEELRDFVREVLAGTDARKVAIVGHSQGGMMPRYYIRFLGGRKRVDEVIGLSPSNHGTTHPLAGPLGASGSCVACGQQAAGSEFMQRVNAGDETPGKVRYTQIQTRHDEVVTPYESAFLEPGRRVTNVLLQDRCPDDRVEHVGIPDDPVALQWIENALGRRGPADHTFQPRC
jgi:triacylglycerol lipase